MAKDKRASATSKNGKDNYLNLSHPLLRSDAYKSLDGWGAKLLIDIAGQFTGNNNGDLCAAWSVLQAKGWKSKGTLHRALNALLKAGLIEQTRQGGRNRCSLFAVTWRSIDECKRKLDVSSTKAPSARYLQLEKMLK